MPLKCKKAFKNRHTVWAKASTSLFLLRGGRWGELITSVYAHMCLCTLEVRELQKQRWRSQPCWPCTRPTSKVTDHTAAFSCSRSHQAVAPRLLPPGCPSPALEQHRKGSAVAISWFLFTTHRSRAPAIDCHAFQVIRKGKFPPPPSCCGFFPPLCAQLLHVRRCRHR